MQSPAHTPLPPAHTSRTPRLFGWLLITICLMAGIWFIAPHQLPVSLYKLSLVTLAAVVGYWLDRSLFPYARPDALMCSSMLDGEPEPVPTWEMGDGMGDGTVGLALSAERTESLVFGMAMLRRAIIVGCAMLAMGLGA
jgi:hypothetical protein